MILDLNFKLKDILGNELQQYAIELVENILLTQTKYFAPLDAYNLAKKLRSEKAVEILKNDLELLYKEIEEYAQLTNLAKGQLLEYIKSLLN